MILDTSTRKNILRSHAVTEDTFLGEGSEAWVYALDSTKVLRIYKNPRPYTEILRMQQFYQSLDVNAVAYELPEILYIDPRKNPTFSIDKRVPGSIFALSKNILNHSTNPLASYYETAKSIRHMTKPYDYFGEILRESPLRRESWDTYLVDKVRQVFTQTTAHLVQDVPNAATILQHFEKQTRLVSDITTPYLVHGDYYPANVLIADSKVSGLTDFSSLTLAGDPRMDLVSAAIFIEATDNQPEVIAYLKDLLMKDYGFHITQIVELYTIYYCFIFSDCKDTDPATYTWAVRYLRGLDIPSD